MESLHISIIAEQVFQLFGVIPVSNSLLTSWLVMVFLLVVSISGTKHLARIPGYFQSVLEVIIEVLRDLFRTILNERSSRFFPFLATLFIFIIFQNWSGLLPGVGTIGIYKIEAEAVEDAHAPVIESDALQDEQAQSDEPQTHEKFVPLFRAGTADLNTTLALALVAMGVVWYSGIQALGGGYIKRYLNFSNPISLFIGLLEIISELSRVMSFSFRLFGNIFAGEVLLIVIAFLMPFLLPIPFLGMELFVGFIQALVFTMLTSVFLSLATTAEEH